MTKPWCKRRGVEEAKEVLEKGIEDWNYLNGEERNGTLHEALYILEEET